MGKRGPAATGRTAYIKNRTSKEVKAVVYGSGTHRMYRNYGWVHVQRKDYLAYITRRTEVKDASDGD